MQPAPDTIAFEQPLNERVRTFLRLELLFAQYNHHAQDGSVYGHRSRLGSLLDVLTVLSRSDLKKDILKELLEQHATLTRLSTRPGVDLERLQRVLDEITEAINDLQQMATQFSANTLRDNEFLITVYNRSTIPGGTCAFDLPVYHFWLSQPAEVIEANIEAWFRDARPFERAILLYLRLLRGSTEVINAVARDGVYVHAPQGSFQLLRVFVARDASIYPEISAGAHRFTIRFMQLGDINRRSGQAHTDLPFKLQCCAL